MQADHTTAMLEIPGGSQGPMDHPLRIMVLGHLMSPPKSQIPPALPAMPVGPGPGVMASPACPPQACRAHCGHPGGSPIPCSDEHLALSPSWPRGSPAAPPPPTSGPRPGCDCRPDLAAPLPPAAAAAPSIQELIQFLSGVFPLPPAAPGLMRNQGGLLTRRESNRERQRPAPLSPPLH